MTDAATVDWVIVKHTRFVLNTRDDDYGHFPTYDDAQGALNGLLQNHEWWTGYTIERRSRAGAAERVATVTPSGDVDKV